MPQDLVRAATAADLNFLVALRDRPASRDAGFIPRGGLEDAIAQGRCHVAEREGQPAGFIIHRHRRDGIVHVPSVCIDEELWRSGLGSRVVGLVLAAAITAKATAMTCKVAIDSPAVGFWRELLGEPIVAMPGRRRWLYGFSRRLTATDSAVIVPPRSQWGRDAAFATLPPPNAVTA